MWGAREEAIKTVCALRDLVMRCQFDGGVDFDLIRNVFGLVALPNLRVERAERLISVLIACKREVFEPKDWKDDEDRKNLRGRELEADDGA